MSLRQHVLFVITIDARRMHANALFTRSLDPGTILSLFASVHNLWLVRAGGVHGRVCNQTLASWQEHVSVTADGSS